MMDGELTQPQRIGLGSLVTANQRRPLPSARSLTALGIFQHLSHGRRSGVRLGVGGDEEGEETRTEDTASSSGKLSCPRLALVRNAKHYRWGHKPIALFGRL